MGPIDFILLLVVAGVCGALGQVISGRRRGGWVISIVLGFIGALLGSWLSRTLELPDPLTIRIEGTRFPVVWSIVGAALFVAILSFLKGDRRKT